MHTVAAARLLQCDLPSLPSPGGRARRPIHPLELPPAEEDHTFEHLAAEKAELFPVEVQLEKFSGPKRTRVIRILRDEDDWPKRPAKE